MNGALVWKVPLPAGPHAIQKGNARAKGCVKCLGWHRAPVLRPESNGAGSAQTLARANLLIMTNGRQAAI